MMDEEVFRYQLGGKIRKLRGQRGLSVQELSRETGLSSELLEKSEAGRALPALGDLMNLANVFDVGMGYFFQSELSDRRVEVVRASERWKVKPESDAAATLNYSYEALSYRLTEKMMSPFYIEIPPSQEKEAEPLSHDGEEFLFILSGEVEITVGEETHRLARGDAIYFDSRISHTVRALGAQPAQMIACLAGLRRASAPDSLERSF